MPIDLLPLPIKNAAFNLRPFSRSGGLSIMGQEQVVASSSETWRAKLTAGLRRQEQVLRYRSIMAQSRGRVGIWKVPVCAGFQVFNTSDFSDDFSSDFSPGRGPIVDIDPAVALVAGTVSGSFLRGATSVNMLMTNPPFYPPLAGQYFSIGDYLYLIASSTATGGVNHYQLTFAPSLRANANDGAAVDFSRPSCLMRLASDDDGQLELESLRFADVTLNFVEVPPS